MNNLISLADNRMIQLADESATKPGKDLTKVDGIAYSGGIFRQPWDNRNMVVDLSGMEISSQIPLLLSHINMPDCRLGMIIPTNDGTKLTIQGGIDTSDEQGKSIVEKGRKYEWQLSIGADVIEAVDVPDGEQFTGNGRALKGPILLITKSKLREVSVVAVGADSDTHLRIAASFKNNVNMSTSTKGVTMKKELIEFIRAKYSLEENCDEAAIKAHLAKINSSVEVEETDRMVKATSNAIVEAREAEKARITAINAMTEEYPEIRAKAISSGWTKDFTGNVISGVKSVTAKLPSTTGNVIVKSPATIDAKSIEAALCMRSGVDEAVILKSCGEQAMDVASTHLRGIGLKDVLLEACRIDHVNIGIGFSNDTIRAGFSTTSLPGILGNVANKRALQAFTAQESVAEKVCSAGDLADFKESERYRLTDIGDLEPISDGGELKSGGLGEDKATNKLKTYGKAFTLTREMIYNDDLGEFLKIPTGMGNRAKRKIDQLFFTRLLANPTQGDTNALFCAAHNNFKSGTTTALGVDSLEKAIALFLDQVDSDGQPISVSPKFLLVPTCLYPLAQRLTTSVLLIGSDSTAPAQNIISNYGLQPIASPFLANAKYSGNSDTGFYLFGDPNQVDTFEIGYFQGRRTPTVERGETDFNTLGLGFRVYFDCGVREQDHRGMVFFKGKA